LMLGKEKGRGERIFITVKRICQEMLKMSIR